MRSLGAVTLFMAFAPAAWAVCPPTWGYAASPPQLMSRPGGIPYDPESLRVAYGIASQATVCPAGVVPTTPPCAVHRVYKPAAGAAVRAPLVVFFAGSGMTPDKHDQVLQMAAYAGYRTIGLSYDNTGTLESQCAAAGDCVDCYGLARNEIIKGLDTRQTALTVVERADSILERLYNLLSALHADDLADGVDDDHWHDYYNAPFSIPGPVNINFLTFNSIRWNKVIVAGFSQGGGHAAKIARDTPVHGFVLLDGGANDSCGVPPTLATWYSAPDASAGRPRYGVSHRRAMNPWVVPAGWLALGFPPTFDDFDDSLLTLTPTQVGITNQRPPMGCNNHNSMALDGCMPTDVGSRIAATTPPDVYLFDQYLRRFCNACDALTCP